MDHKAKSETSIPIAKPKVIGQTSSQSCIKLGLIKATKVPGLVDGALRFSSSSSSS
jgi:hypothetical protein